MKTRRLGPFAVSAVGLGCMSLSHAYGEPPADADAVRLLHHALDVGYTLLDTASVYGLGHNESLIGRTLKARRDEFVLASKCGLGPNAEGRRELTGRPDDIRRTCDDSLRRLQVEIIDLYYLHRLDRRVPIEDSVGTLGDLVREGKIRAVGLSEIGADTLRRGHAEFPITALQSEYSLWTRNPEVATLSACEDLGVAFVAFSPVGRGLLTGAPPDPQQFRPADIRTDMPRFHGEAWVANLVLQDQLAGIAGRVGCTPAQLAIAWTLSRGAHVIPIPGTGNLDHMVENAEAAAVTLTPAVLEELETVINARTVTGVRYSPAAQATVDTEEVPFDDR
jgi:aryl-alcohol dehydrogenase-like predicted oxidoreductase